MLLSINEMEVKEVRFDETFPPGEIDFSGSEVTQTGPLHVVGVAELLHNTGGEVRIQGRMTTTIEAVCDRCLGTARFPLMARLTCFTVQRRTSRKKMRSPSTRERPRSLTTASPGWCWKIS